MVLEQREHRLIGFRRDLNGNAAFCPGPIRFAIGRSGLGKGLRITCFIVDKEKVDVKIAFVDEMRILCLDVGEEG